MVVVREVHLGRYLSWTGHIAAAPRQIKIHCELLHEALGELHVGICRRYIGTYMVNSNPYFVFMIASIDYM